MSQLPPLTALRCFEAAARLGGVTLAARELHVTHSAVSQQIRILEELMGVALFVREARGLKLTEAGRLYALDIRVHLRGLAQATRMAQARPHHTELVIATLPSFALHWLLPRMGRFRERHPFYRVRFQTSLELQDLRHGMADVGIRMGQGHWPELEQQQLFDDELLVVASPLFNAGQLPQTPAEVVSSTIISSHDAAWDNWCQHAGVNKPDGAHGWSANDSNIVLSAVRMGEGIALERRSLVADALARGELVQLTDIRVPYPYAYWLVWPVRDVANTKQVHFAEWLQEEVAAYLNQT